MRTSVTSKAHMAEEIEEIGMDVNSRIEQAAACKIINLCEKEKDLYTGAGWRLARFIDGNLTELVNPFSLLPWEVNLEKHANDILNKCFEWAQNGNGEIWLVMCSGYQLCEPEPFHYLNPINVAKLGRIIGDELSS